MCNHLCHISNRLNSVFLCACGISLEPHCEGSDWLWAAGCQGDGVFGSEEVCAQRPCSAQLHVSNCRAIWRKKTAIHS